jgi:hemolysin activation/secretion protein
VERAFGALSAAAAYYYTLPVPLRPVLVLRANAKKLFGDFPYHESAFVGGRGSVRVLDRERYAGDALLGGTTELQIPLGTVPLVLPFDIGVYGFADAGRVYLDGASPGGWHTSTGIGFWVGILNPSTALTVELGKHRGRSLTRIKTGLNF